MDASLKQKTAKTLKWNTVDRVLSQVLYAVTGVVLANLLSKEDFGLVGALLVFQAFGILFVDSGFGASLLRRKDVDERDYSTVFWFNLAVSVAVYIVLFFAAPLIAMIFQDDRRLIPLSRVMFLTFILNGLGMVQTTRLMKRMDVKQIAVANTVGLTLSGGLGMWLAFEGFGPWALVWQSVGLSAVKSGWLWCATRWRPMFCFCRESIAKMWRVGVSVFATSSLNTFFLYIYSFVIGAFYNLASLGVYTQADKWSKMGSASISQIFTASFVPLLAGVQDNGEEFHAYMRKINRFSAFILFPAMIGLAAIGAPLFHTLFGHKWDMAIPLFQILTIRGIFVVLLSVYNNYLLALGYARRLVAVELIKDCTVIAAVLLTVWGGSIELLVWGQLAASVVTWIAVLAITCRATGYRSGRMLADILPYAATATAMGAATLAIGMVPDNPVVKLTLMIATGVLFYALAAILLRFPETRKNGLQSMLSRRRR